MCATGAKWGEEYRWLCKKPLQVKPQKGEKERKTKIGTENKGNEWKTVTVLLI